MNNVHKDLYKWEKVSKPRVYSRSQRITTGNDIQDWLKTVEDVSDRATSEVFGHTEGRKKAKKTVENTVIDAQLHEAAYSEAQDLLNQWVTDKIHLENDLDDEEIWNRKTQAEIKSEWDNLLGHDDDLDVRDDYEEVLKSARLYTPKSDPYKVLDEDEGEMVAGILDKLRKKEVVKDKFVKDLGFDDPRKHKDPAAKMKLRQQQVKENREKRMNEKEKRLRELQAKKDAHFTAKQMIKKEEKEKASVAKKEELAIQQEMARIRRDMELERKREEERKQREKKENEETERRVMIEYEKQKFEDMEKQKRAKEEESIRRRQILKKMEELQEREVAENMKMLQRYFSAWYGVVVERRLQMGKARAMADWRLLLRSWNAWKAYSRSKRVEVEAWNHEEELKAIHRKNIRASQHYKLQLLRKCFTAWQFYVDQSQVDKQLGQKHDVIKNKMSSFLQAASSGRLWNKDDDVSSSSQPSHRKTDSARRAVDDIFSQPTKKKAGSLSERSGTSTVSERSDVRAKSSRRGSPTKPTAAWQLTRKDVQLTKEELKSLGKGDTSRDQDSTTQGDPYPSERGDDTSPSGPTPVWKRKPYQVNNMEHRHNSQQKILENQQKQIKEQQRLIEELTYLQKQQLLQQQLMSEKDQASPLPDHMAEHMKKMLESMVKQGDIPDTPGAESLDIDLSSFASGGQNKQHKQSSQRNDTVTDRSSTSTRISPPESIVSSTTSRATSVNTVNSKHEQFVKAMNDRAADRKRIKEERDLKRQQQEVEKMAELLKREQEIKEKEEEDKRKKIEAYKEKKRLDKLKEREKEERVERMKHLNILAEEHFKRSLLKYRGILAFKKLVNLRKEKERLAAEHYSHTLLRKCVLSWHGHVSEECQHKKYIADQFNKYLIVKRCFRNWRRYGDSVLIQEEKARRFYEQNIKHRVLMQWADYAAEEKIAVWRKERVANEHNKIRMVKTYFLAWKRFPAVLKDETKREERLNEMRKKVSSLIPDFGAVSDSATKSSFERFLKS